MLKKSAQIVGEVRDRVYPLLPALQRAELSTHAPSLLLYAFSAENEEEEELWPFAAERFGPALLALDRQALHRAWSDLLHVLGAHERTTLLDGAASLALWSLAQASSKAAFLPITTLAPSTCSAACWV